MKEKTIAVDFDGVIHAYSKGWHDGTIYDPPIQGCRDALEMLIAEGYRVLIFTTRAANRTIDGVEEAGQLQEVVAYLNRWEIPFHEVFAGEKPIYTAIIDDRAIRFDGDWSRCQRELERLAIIHSESPSRPTVAELEAILNKEEDNEIEILPNGEIRALGSTDKQQKPLTMREQLGGEYGAPQRSDLGGIPT